MIKINGEQLELGNFPDGTLLMKKKVTDKTAEITWLYEKDEELVALIFITKHLKAHGVMDVVLNMPYIPNARQDRVKRPEDVFTLKYFAEVINSLEFKKVLVLDPHSYVSEALIDRIEIQSPKNYVDKVIDIIENECETKNENVKKRELLMFYPDEGAMKRYSSMFERPYAFGIKKRDWSTGKIQGLEVSGQTDRIKGSTVLIVDDICSRGGTFYFSAEKLKELGADKVYLYISHCENTIIEGDILNSELIEKVYTTNSIFTDSHEKIQVIEVE